MNLRRKWAAIVASTGLGLSPGVQAADIDIYTQGSSSSAPNVLVFIDNTSNWSAANQAWSKTEVNNKCGGNKVCEGYVTQVFGSESTLEQGRIELRALKLVLNELACATTKPLSINVGLMLLNTAGTVDSPSGNSGYISRRILPLEPGAESCTKLIEKLDLIDSKITEPDYKGPSSADYGSSLFEAFKYFGGYANTNNVAATAMGSPAGAKGFGPTRYSKAYSLEDPLAFGDDSSKTTYNSPIGEDFCGDNYILLIGNQFPNQEYGTDQNKTPPTNSVMGYLGLAPDQIFTVKNKADIRFADEWSRFLASTDVSATDGQQAVKTFAINVFNKTEDTKQTELLTNMAKYGGTGAGGVFKVGGDLGALIKALQSVLTQIAAVNSAFASASLPISVNTQGTYLNQVFIGMFRPDAGAKPRWAGNLKQYQFKLETAGSTRTLSLADANGDSAIDNANTGFLQNCARSFWTTDTDTYWKTVTATPHEIPVGSCEKHENSDSPDGSIVERGGAAEKIRLASPSTRAIQTCDASNCTSSANFTPSSDLRKWIRGDNIGDGYDYFDINTSAVVKVSETYSKATTETRPTVHGGVIHSRPLAINYGASGKDEIVVFYGADDGILRAINGSKDEEDAASGKELWAFLPPEFESRLQRNHDNYPLVKFFDSPTDQKDFFFDGSLGAYAGPEKADGTGSAKKYLYATMRRGGNMLYAFDITTSPASGTPTPMWRFGCTDAANTNCFGGGDVAKIGQTWSTPRIVRVKGQSALYAVFGAGYDPCEDTEPRDCSKDITGNGLFVLDAQSGTQLRFIDFGAEAGHVVADIVPIDTNNDGYSDVLYAADTLGNLWRVNLTDTATSTSPPQTQNNWIVTHIAKVGDWSSTNEKNRKFLYAPDVVTVGAYNIVLIGTGNREKPLDTSKAALVKNRFYGFWDEYAKTSTYVLINDSNDCDSSGDTTLKSGCQVMNTSDVTLNYNDAFASTSRPRGWVIELDSTKFGAPYEQVVTTAATIGGYVNFSTFQAKNEKKCSSLGTARGYATCFLHGGASCEGAVAAGTNRSEKFVGGGLPPSPVAGTVEVDGKIVPFIIGGKPEAPGGSALEAKLPPIPIKKDRVKVYRYKQID